MKYIIGISAFYYESSVALLEDGIVKEFLKEESLQELKEQIRSHHYVLPI